MRDEIKAIATRLGDEHPIKRIIVDVWKLRNIDTMAGPHRQLNKPHLDCNLPDSLGSYPHLLRMLLVLDGNLPKRNRTEIQRILWILQNRLRLSAKGALRQIQPKG